MEINSQTLSIPRRSLKKRVRKKAMKKRKKMDEWGLHTSEKEQ